MKTLNVNINGNKKLVNNDKVRFLIWNLPSVKTCPFATELCKKSCYAKKAEAVYPSVLPSRETNYNDSLQADFVANMIFTIEKYRASKAFCGRLMVVRIHESGDFYSKDYAQKWLAIIRHFADDNTIIFHCYTKSLLYFEGENVKQYKNLAFIASVWADTDEKAKALIVKNEYRIYTAVDSFENWTGAKCRCSDCAHCMQCMNNNCSSIACEIH